MLQAIDRRRLYMYIIAKMLFKILQVKYQKISGKEGTLQFNIHRISNKKFTNELHPFLFIFSIYVYTSLIVILFIQNLVKYYFKQKVITIITSSLDTNA